MALGVPPRTPGRLRRKIVAGGSAPRHPLGSVPDPGGCAARMKLGASPQTSAGAPPQTPFTRGSGGGASSFALVAKPPGFGAEPQRGSGGGAPSNDFAAKPPGSGAEPQRGSDGGAPSNDLAVKPPRGLGRRPKRHGPPSWLRPWFLHCSGEMLLAYVE